MKQKNPIPSSSSPRSLPIRVAKVAMALLMLVAVPAWLRASTGSIDDAPGSAPIATAGQDSFTVTDMEWTDAGRGRRVPVRLFWPASAKRGKAPLIVFSHGIGSSRDGYTYLGRYWASHGIASLHLQHVGSDRTLWHGSVLSLVARFQHAAGDQEAIARAQDLSFALDRLLQSERGAHIARDRIVAAGHSYGANTTLLAAGAKVVRNGRLLQFRDPRLCAAIVISAPPFYGEKDFAPILSGIRIPTLHITTADDVIRIPGFGSGLEDRVKVFNATGGAFKALAVYKQGSHNVFTE
ncbi:MAG: alpha/beta hydrolase family protein, partial [Pseudoxanthomonas sp.]